MGRNAIEKRKEHPLPPSPPVPFYRLGRSTWPCTRRSHMSFLLSFVRTLPFPYYLSVPSPPPPVLARLPREGREGGSRPRTMNYPELPKIGANFRQPATIRLETRRPPSMRCSFRTTKRRNTRCPRELSPPSGTWRARLTG